MVAYPGVTLPALQGAEGARDRPARRRQCTIARVPGGIERPLPVVARHEALGDPAWFKDSALGQLPAVPPAVVAAIGAHDLRVALDQVEDRSLVRDVAGREDRRTRPEPGSTARCIW